MTLRRLAPAIPLVAALLGCEDPAPLSQVEASATTTAGPKASQNAKNRAALQPRRPQLSGESMKRLRAELCYYAGFGARYAVKSYAESLGSSEPSAKKIPSFGEYAASPQRTPPRAAGRLPFDRHLRACSAAARLAKGTWPELDAALDAFSPQAMTAARALSTASRYYARMEYEKDDFARGKESHEQIEGLTKLAQAHETYAKAFNGWLAKQPPLEKSEERNAVGKRSGAVVTAARKVAGALLDKPRSPEKETTEALAGLRASLEKLSDTGPQTSLLSRHAKALIDTADELPAGELSAKDRHRVAQAMIAVLEADGRIVRTSLRGTQPRVDPRKPAGKLKARLPEDARPTPE